MRRGRRQFGNSFKFGLAMVLGMAIGLPAVADDRPAKQVFGHTNTPSAQSPQPVGFYSKGCQAGAIQIPVNGPTWQAMRLSRDRRWGQPELIATIEKLSRDAAQYDGWPGVLVGDMSQARGGPMLTGHASHQVGLDVDIWLTPMPGRALTAPERENLSAVSVLKKGAFLTLDRNVWTPAHARLIMRAASYPEVERIFVTPPVKKELCERWTGDRSNLRKVRPYYGHDYHFHVRLSCPAGSANCKSQAAVPVGDGCGAPLAWWFTEEPWRKPEPPKPGTPAPKPRVTRVSDLPGACRTVLAAPAGAADGNMGVAIAAKASSDAESGVPITSLASSPVLSSLAPVPVSPDVPEFPILPEVVPLPLSRPVR